MGNDDKQAHEGFYSGRNFNPRSRVGNDIVKHFSVCQFYISIHVPAWGTTRYNSKNLLSDRFQSTFPRGERPHLSVLTSGLSSFQSTFPRGERLESGQELYVDGKFQSTFPRGERQSKVRNRFTQTDFNPRSRVGNDGSCQSFTSGITYFNPRSRVGNDSKLQASFFGLGDFNPRSRVGNDDRVKPLSDGWCISIHVPAWGTTIYICTS